MEQHWVCPNCMQTAVTRAAPNRFHSCAGLKGLTAPMVLDGTKAKIEVISREDYTNGDRVPRDGEGNVVMSVVTTRDEGQDCTVFAPVASGMGVAT